MAARRCLCAQSGCRTGKENEKPWIQKMGDPSVPVRVNWAHQVRASNGLSPPPLGSITTTSTRKDELNRTSCHNRAHFHALFTRNIFHSAGTYTSDARTHHHTYTFLVRVTLHDFRPIPGSGLIHHTPQRGDIRSHTDPAHHHNHHHH